MNAHSLLLSCAVLLIACSSDPNGLTGNVNDGVDDVDSSASALTGPGISWMVYSEADRVTNLAACQGRVYKLTTDRRVLSADAYRGDGYPTWSLRRTTDGSATQITCGYGRIGSASFGSYLFYKTPAGTISYEAVSSPTSLIWDRSGLAGDARELKAFSTSDLWALNNSLWGYLGRVANLGPEILWSQRGYLWAAKRTAATTDRDGNRLVIAINQDNTFWLSRDAGVTFSPMAASVDNALVGAYAVEIEAMRGADDRIYVYALVNGPYLPYVYRGVFTP